MRMEGFVLEKNIKERVDREGRQAVKELLGDRLWSIYEDEVMESHKSGEKLTYGVVAEKCFCDQRTIERMVHPWDPQLPTIYNLWLFYEALDVSSEEQLSIQKEITGFIRTYIKTGSEGKK